MHKPSKKNPRRPPRAELDAALRSLAIAAAAIATYCDHSEHGQPAERSEVIRAADVLRRTGVNVARLVGLDAIDLYAQRLARIESESVLSTPQGFSVTRAVASARTWRDLQIVQEQHDRHFHPDVFGLPRIGQLRHCALHAAKFPGAIGSLGNTRVAWTRFVDGRLPDMLLFGLKLPTIMGERLPRTRIPRAG